MKTFYYTFLMLTTLVVSVSCEKHEIEYNSTPLEEDMVEFQLHYFAPVTASAANYIYRVEINDKLYANTTAPLNTYNAVPSGTVGRFYAVKPGAVNIKLYMTSNVSAIDENLYLAYEWDVTLSKGKQNLIVYDFNKAPLIFDNGYPYETNITGNTDTTCWVKFYNFLYEKEDEPTTLKLQYQYQYIKNISTGEKSEWINIGDPVGFGETTGWQPVTVIKSVFNSAGSANIDYKIKVQGTSGKYTEDLKLWNSNSEYVSYSDYWTGYIGRRYHHIFGGMRSARPVASVRQFTAL